MPIIRGEAIFSDDSYPPGTVKVFGKRFYPPQTEDQAPTWCAARAMGDGVDILDAIEEARARFGFEAEFKLAAHELVTRWPTSAPPSLLEDAMHEEGWPPLVPFDLPTAPEPRLDIDNAFVDSGICGYVRAVANQYRVPVEMPALLTLPIVLNGLAASYEIRVTPDWREQPALFVFPLGDSGLGKTGVRREMQSPVNEVVHRMIEQWKRVYPEQRSSHNRYQSEVEDLERKLAKRHDPALEMQLQNLLADPVPEPDPQPNPNLTDATNEALIMTIAEQQRPILLLASEGDCIDVILGRYTSGQFAGGAWLQGYDAESIRLVRKTGKDQLLIAEHPIVNVGIAAQPIVGASLFANRDAMQRGLVPRGIFVYLRDLIGDRQPSRLAPPISEELRSVWRERVTWAWQGQEHQPDGRESLYLTDDALEMVHDFGERLEPLLRKGGHLGEHRAWGAKLVGRSVRIAAALWAMDGQRESLIDRRHTAAAIEVWAPYLIEALHHCEIAVRSCDQWPSRRMWHAIVRYADRPEFTGQVTHRQLHESVRSPAMPTAEHAAPWIQDLVDRGYIRPAGTVTGARGGRPSTLFDVRSSALPR